MSVNDSIVVPIVTFVLGWGSGVITAWAMYRDHERRIANVENMLVANAEKCEKNTQDLAVLWQRVRDGRATKHEHEA